MDSIDRAQAAQLQISPWDQLASHRAHDIDSGRDISFVHVLRPTIAALLTHIPSRTLIDVGCGTGRLFQTLSQFSDEICGIDPSSISIDYALSYAKKLGITVELDVLRVEDYLLANKRTFDVVVCNMVLMDVVNLGAFVNDIARLCRQGGNIIVTVTHPTFWPRYWRYDQEPWFSYTKEIFIRSEFKTSLTSTGISTLHCHRPLSMYVRMLRSAGLAIEAVIEPMLPKEIQGQAGVEWTEPHFMAILCSKAMSHR